VSIAAGLAWRLSPCRSPAARMSEDLQAIEGEGLPPIEVLAARQHAASILATNWETVSERLGGVFSGSSVATATSVVHGVGLFAQEDLDEGEFVAFHPVHRILQSLEGGQVAGTLVDEADEEYFRPSNPSPDLTPDALAYRQVAFRQTYSNVNPDKPERFLLDANPTKPDVTGWLGHRINDGSSLAPGSSDEEITRYYRSSAEKSNCCAVATCVPLLAFVTTVPVSKGEELLTTYGHGYWLQQDVALGKQALEALAVPAREASLWQYATMQKYALHFNALEEFLRKMSDDMEDDVEPEGG